MSDEVLSQDEINALLEGAGDVPPEEPGLNTNFLISPAKKDYYGSYGLVRHQRTFCAWISWEPH